MPETLYTNISVVFNLLNFMTTKKEVQLAGIHSLTEYPIADISKQTFNPIYKERSNEEN